MVSQDGLPFASGPFNLKAAVANSLLAPQFAASQNLDLLQN
jgi:hypothetical protein